MNDIEQRLSILEQEIEAIKIRNSKVEADKAWETIHFRTVCLLLLTFFFTALVFWLIGIESYFRNATIPTIAYYISTRTIPLLKSWWIADHYSK